MAEWRKTLTNGEERTSTGDVAEGTGLEFEDECEPGYIEDEDALF